MTACTKGPVTKDVIGRFCNGNWARFCAFLGSRASSSSTNRPYYLEWITFSLISCKDLLSIGDEIDCPEGDSFITFRVSSTVFHENCNRITGRAYRFVFETCKQSEWYVCKLASKTESCDACAECVEVATTQGFLIKQNASGSTVDDRRRWVTNGVLYLTDINLAKSLTEQHRITAPDGTVWEITSVRDIDVAQVCPSVAVRSLGKCIR